MEFIGMRKQFRFAPEFGPWFKKDGQWVKRVHYTFFMTQAEVDDLIQELDWKGIKIAREDIPDDSS